MCLQDFIFNNGGLSVAFIFETSWDCGNGAAVFSRCDTLSCYVVQQHAAMIVHCNDRNGGFSVGTIPVAG